MFFKYFKNLIFILVIGAVLAPSVGAQVLSSGQLNNPYKLAVSNGYLYSVDTANNKIKKFDAAGNLVYSYGSSGSGNGQFNQPQGIAVDSNGYIYVVDTGNQRIQKLYDNGTSATFVQSIFDIPELSDPTFSFPRSIRVDDNGDIFIVDSAKNRVIKHSTGTVIGGGAGGGVSAMSVGGSSGIFNAPYGADIDNNGYVCIADTENHKIKKYSLEGKLLLEFGSQGQGNGKFLYPFDVAVDPNGNMFVADTGNHRIQKFDRFGNYVTSYGSLGTSDGKFFAPRGVFISKYGYLYVVGADNKIQRLDVFIHITDLVVIEPIISPNWDKVKDQTDIKFNLSEAALVNVNIYNSTGSILVRKLATSKKMEAGENYVSWGGVNDEGKIVADGEYVIKITAKSSDGKKDAIPVSANISVDATYPNLIVSAPEVFLEYGSGKINEIIIPYSISENAEIELEILSEEDGAIFKAENSISDVSKKYEFIWDGKDEKGDIVKTRKEYSFNISANDAAGNTIIYSDSFITDDIVPEIKNAEVSKSIFSPIMNYPTEISFEISDNIFDPLSNLEIEIRDFSADTGQYNNVIKILRATKSIRAGAVNLSWDGKYEKGDIVPDGIYQIAVSIEDGVGNKSEYFAEVETDTIPPIITTSQNLYAFSPNGDGKYDSVDFFTRTNEKGNIFFNISSEALAGTEIFNEEISAEAYEEIKFVWKGISLEVYRRNSALGVWELEKRIENAEKPADGEYTSTVYAIDEAGNISENIIQKTIVDTTPPLIQKLAADPNPFTPNEDGVKDTTIFNYQLSEPAYVTTSIYREDGGLFRKHEGPTENFSYPTLASSLVSRPSSVGEWEWDGRGSRNELLGGEYTYSVAAEDWVGNSVSSETKTVVVDRAPSLVPYAFAEPDPFSPVNPDNSYTEIKYYLGRDNLNVSVSIQGEGNSVIKSLVNSEVQNKGEHTIRWYGDFGSGYSGSTAIKNEYRVGDGSYEFRVVAADPDGGQPANLTNTVLVDNTPPHIVAKPVQVDYTTKRATLEYNVPENSTVEVEVYDEDDLLVETLMAGEAKSPGDYTLDYDFSRKVDNKKRYFKITAKDRALNIAEKKTEAFAVLANPLQIAEHQVVPSTFTPNGDGFTDLTQIKYKISGGAPDLPAEALAEAGYIVNVDIVTETGATIKTLVENEPQSAGTYSYYWDGKDEGGETIDDGRYEYVITIEDQLGTKVPSTPSMGLGTSPLGASEGRGTILVVSTRPTVDLSVTPSIFSPNGDGASDTVLFNYSIDYPMQYITGEALVKLEVINSSGEAVWTKIFNHTAGTYSYEYNGETADGGRLTADNYYLRASAEDALGSTAVPKTVGFAIDYSQPEPSDFSIDPAYAKLGAEVKISLNFEEELAEAPTVMIYMPDEASRETTLVSSSGNSYEYSYVIGELDAEGKAVVSVTARDLAFNPINKTKEFVVDTTSPEVSNLAVSPNPASTPEVSGQVSIKFDVSEALKEAPRVNVTQSGASPQLAIVSGQWAVAGGQVEAKYDVFSGNDGAAIISVEATDLANNQTTYQSNNPLTVDTVAPIFTNIQSAISANPEFAGFARAGSVVTVKFKTSEDLKFNPDVRINGNAAAYDSLISDEYTYKYTVDSNDAEGNAAITISGYDYAGNEGTVETSSSSESFVIDLENPTVAIAPPQTPGEYISNPGAFSTNANPDGSDIPRATMFYYKLAEYSKVTVKVHKVGDSQTTYSKSDFTGSNLIKTLINDQWQQGGIGQTVIWDGTITNNTSSYDTNNDGYADPGKYAFIAEGRDRAGNLTLKKWGGTVWIQNNVLDLREPDQKEYEAEGLNPKGNPDPPSISPNGNSIDPTQKRARFYFMIDLSSNPDSGTVKDPERIEASAVIADGKAVGKYSVKVYGDIGLTNLVRTITSEETAQSATLTWEDWDGKDDNGQFVADGTYYLAVDVKDYAGNPANDNLLTRAVVVDNTPPVVSNLSTAPYYFSPDTDSTIDTTTLTYEVSDNSGKAKVTIDVIKGVSPVKTLLSNTWKNNGEYLQNWDGGRSGGGYVGAQNGTDQKDGVYTFNVSAIDEAGNSAEVKVKDVMVDTEGPIISAGGQAPDVWYSSNNAITVSLSDAISYQGFKWNWDSWSSTDPAGANTAASDTTYHPGQGEKDLYIRAWDDAGNRTDVQKTYKRDYTYPQAVFGGQAPDVWYSPDNTITINLSDSGGSGYRGFKWNWDSWPSTDPSGCNTSTSGTTTHGSQGPRTLYVRVWDWAGNRTDISKVYKKDSTDPSISFGGQAAGVWYSADNAITVNLSDNLSYRGYKWSWDGWPSTDPSGCNTSTSGSTNHSQQGTRTLYVRAWDLAGNRKDASSTYYRDSVAPVISGVGSGTFNPYVDDNISISFSASDSSPSSGFSVSNISAKIKYGANDVKNLTVYDDGSSNFHVVWDGTNNPGDYENEGNYTLEISASDAVGNPATIKTSTITLQDDQRITNNSADSNSPGLTISGSTLILKWIEGDPDDSQDDPNSPAHASEARDWWDSGWGPWVPFNIDHDQEVKLTLSSGGNVGDQAMQWDVDDGAHTSHTKCDLSNPKKVWLTAGSHQIRAYVASNGIAGHHFADVYAYFKDRKYNQYSISSSNLGQTWGSITGPVKVDNYSTGPLQVTVNGIIHKVWTNNGIYYQRNSSNSVKISSGGFNLSIAADVNGNAYIAWDTDRDWLGNPAPREIYFQKIPSNFARINNTAQGTSIVGGEKPASSQQTTFEPPTLVSPDDQSDVRSIRPTFTWQHRKSSQLPVASYRLDIAKNDTFTIDKQTFTKLPNSGSPDKPGGDPNLYFYTYSIHEFDPGLDRDTYYWRVTANATNESATSEVRSFTVAPQLTLTGVTNYPNPFNPNREATKIRYRLGADADEVRIRIYDVVGSLVKEITGCPTDGEGSSVWQKYNDVSWDGKNGRGDKVVNGIYPFEVIARLGDRSVSARGKIAALK